MISVLHKDQPVELLPVHARLARAAFHVSNHSRRAAETSIALDAANLARHASQIANGTVDC